MSPVLEIMEQSAAVLAVAHNEQLVLLPANVAVGGWFQSPTDEHLTARQRHVVQHLLATNIEVTDIVHIRRRDLDELGVDVSGITTIQLTDTGTNYRVEVFQDDPGNGPDVEFFCKMA